MALIWDTTLKSLMTVVPEAADTPYFTYKGVPNEIIEESKKKMRAINSAFDKIEKMKSSVLILF